MSDATRRRSSRRCPAELAATFAAGPVVVTTKDDEKVGPVSRDQCRAATQRLDHRSPRRAESAVVMPTCARVDDQGRVTAAEVALDDIRRRRADLVGPQPHRLVARDQRIVAGGPRDGASSASGRQALAERSGRQCRPRGGVPRLAAVAKRSGAAWMRPGPGSAGCAPGRRAAAGRPHRRAGG
jgi:hypothetical protein